MLERLKAQFRAEPEIYWIAGLVFVLTWLHGATSGLSDDEAYYWVLSQKPAWGYAYHPPAVAWVLWLFQKTLGWIIGMRSSAIVRLPAATLTAGILILVQFWLRRAGITRSQHLRSMFLFLAFPAVFGSSWMMVPDLPLFFGWMLSFLCAWKFCRQEGDKWDFCGLALGVALAMLSKYSAVLAAGSAMIALFFWGRRQRVIGVLAVLCGLALALVPIILWNRQTHWESLVYQVQGRHSGHFSFIRYARFWLIEVVIAGLPLIVYGFHRGWSGFKRWYADIRQIRNPLTPARFVGLWALPGALVFCLQPAWSDFKLHWVFVVWFPLMLDWSLQTGLENYPVGRRWVTAQKGYSFFLIAFAWTACHLPLLGWMEAKVFGRAGDPRWDVTNDLYGWSRLAKEVEGKLGRDALDLPLIGSRYQTASQAALAWPAKERVSLVPRGLKERDEWSTLDAVDHQGPEWPTLLRPVLYVADNRYTAAPEFKGAHCEQQHQYAVTRYGVAAKSFVIWKCLPR